MLHVLIVEDSPTVRYVLKSMINEHGGEVMTAANGSEAIQMATEQKPDLILLDVILPKMNGYQVCRRIKSNPETAHIPVVMITSKAKEADRYWGMEQGADDYIVKPVDANAIADVIQRFGTKVS